MRVNICNVGPGFVAQQSELVVFILLVRNQYLLPMPKSHFASLPLSHFLPLSPLLLPSPSLSPLFIPSLPLSPSSLFGISCVLSRKGRRFSLVVCNEVIGAYVAGLVSLIKTLFPRPCKAIAPQQTCHL